MVRLHHLLGTVAILSMLMACQASQPSGGGAHANSGGATGSGGAGIDASAEAGNNPNTGGNAAGGSGGALASSGGANATDSGTDAVSGGANAADSGTDASNGTDAAGGGTDAGSGGTDAADGGADAAGGSTNQGGRGGTMGGRGGSTSSGGAGGRGGQGEVCPFTSAEHFIWSGVVPGVGGTTVVQTTTERSTNPQVRDRMIAGVTKPSLFPYLAPRPNGAAVIVIPGGGYRYLAFDKEGVDIATWLNSLGVSAFVLKYRLPSDFPGSTWVALADAQRAIRLIRKSAAACKIDPTRIGVIGFSAGGHLASQLETRFSARPTPPADDVDAIDARPAFGMLLYPVISMDPAIAHAGSKAALLGASPTPADVALHSSELQVTSTTPPTFIGTSIRDTTVKPENSVRFDDALVSARVAHELHLYQDGGHGTGIRDASGDMASWPAQCASWLGSSKFLSGPLP